MSKSKTCKRVLLSILVIFLVALLSFGIYATCLVTSHYKVEPFDITKTPINDQHIKIMSSNIRTNAPTDFGDKSWYNRSEHILEQIEEEAPDIIGFQEVMASQNNFLSKKLIGYDYEITYRQDKLLGAEGTPIFFREDKFLLKDKG